MLKCSQKYKNIFILAAIQFYFLMLIKEKNRIYLAEYQYKAFNISRNKSPNLNFE
jgi:hypothetical protein